MREEGGYSFLIYVANYPDADKDHASIELRLYESSKYNLFTLARFISKSRFCVNGKV